MEKGTVTVQHTSLPACHIICSSNVFNNHKCTSFHPFYSAKSSPCCVVYLYQLTCLPVDMAMFEEMHAMVTVWQGVPRESPAPRVASLAMLLVRTSWITVPTTTWFMESVGGEV